nr:DUF4874 domain-containing protein [uncultured Mediterraneibacter sp.]
MKRKKLQKIVASVVLVLGMAFAAKTIMSSAEEDVTHYNLTKPYLSGEESSLLLSNPDRGLRMETYMDVATGKSVFEYADEDAIAQLNDQISLYKSDDPRLVQVYFYLTGYKEKALDETAFSNMEKYFEELRKNDLKAVLRFAYISDDSNPVSQEPTTAQIEQHMQQLSSFITNHKDQIHVFQMGLVGAWGEWDSGARSRMAQDDPNCEKKIIYAVLNNIPDDMYVQVRYLNIKNNNIDKQDTKNWNRVGYHDDFLIGNLHGWNTAGSNPQSEGWQQMTEESKNLLVDGEMIWGSANEYYKNNIGGTVIDSVKMAKRLKEHHFTSLSMTHNYKEKGQTNYSMTHWQHEYINQKTLEKNSLPYAPGWFKDENGNNISRTMFEYIRDYLGYYLVLENAEATVEQESVDLNLTLKNYGFAAPLALKDVDIVLLDSDGNEVCREKLCDPSDLQPEQEVTIEKTLVKPDANRAYRLALSIRSEDGTGVRLGNDMEMMNGYQVLGDL